MPSKPKKNLVYPHRFIQLRLLACHTQGFRERFGKLRADLNQNNVKIILKNSRTMDFFEPMEFPVRRGDY